MAASRRPGYQCAYRYPENIDDQTSCLAESPKPEVTCHYKLTALESKLAKDDDDPEARLKRLRKAAIKTPLGAKFLGQLKSKNGPPVIWGETANGHKGEWDGKHIILDETKTLTDAEWEQVIVMELGNATNNAKLEEIYDSADKGEKSKDEFADDKLGLEIGPRNEVVLAHKNGEFGDPRSRSASRSFLVVFCPCRSSKLHRKGDKTGRITEKSGKRTTRKRTCERKPRRRNEEEYSPSAAFRSVFFALTQSLLVFHQERIATGERLHLRIAYPPLESNKQLE